MEVGRGGFRSPVVFVGETPCINVVKTEPQG